ncbi:hypothetical protein CANCADRAFT_31801 [Tortispora caseinolytica NRRL Y-17796]|uniref:Uncharacterized protein n=1 Tax=Tortispora caseinolytica NRRL Y-17796 TaxID=767744 RepID=A0A1E4TGY1_9ASCO|nr:hypothetical protein CANCADRAFT_31801 [Tortispora caseinolytica NRRL Y-17796]
MPEHKDKKKKETIVHKYGTIYVLLKVMVVGLLGLRSNILISTKFTLQNDFPSFDTSETIVSNNIYAII